MRFKQGKNGGSQMPEVNLVPMMDVLMTVLTFFIIISMTLTGQQLLNVELPKSAADAPSTSDPEPTAEPLVIGLDRDGQLILAEQPVPQPQLLAAVRQYWLDHPDGLIQLKADRSLSYDNVATLLADLEQVGGGQVSLAIE